MLDELLKYHDQPAADEFTAQVMARVRRQQMLRRAILWGSGLVGAGFGVAGMLLLSGSVANTLTEAQVLPISVGAVGVVSLFVWLFQDEASVTG